MEEEKKRLREKMERIKHKVAVISGKGGVGKTMVTVNLAVALADKGYSVGVLDADIHGPTVPKMLGLKGETLKANPIEILPVLTPQGIKVISMDFLLPGDEFPVIWRGPLKMKAIQQFLSETMWGDLDFLLIDLPPGTGDEPLSVMQLIEKVDGVVIVTIPSDVSKRIVKKAVTFSRQLGAPIIGIVENMSGFICPNCGAKVDIFMPGGGREMAEELNVPFLGSIPLDPDISRGSDGGRPFIVDHPGTPAAIAFSEIVDRIEVFLGLGRVEAQPEASS